jgi:hypothetical protein
LARGRLTTQGFLFVSHHFMSRAQLATPLGQERVAQCVFHVPVNGALVSMCEVNALGIRETYYAEITRARAAEVVRPQAHTSPATSDASPPPPSLVS